MSATMKALAERRSPEREMIPRTLLWAMLALALSALVITSFAVLRRLFRPRRRRRIVMFGCLSNCRNMWHLDFFGQANAGNLKCAEDDHEDEEHNASPSQKT